MHLTEECQRMNQRASKLYENGDYSGAKRLWEEVLKLSPTDPQALQGCRMASVLAESWSPLPSAAAGGETAGPAGQIDRMLETGRVAEAMAAAQKLLADHPSDALAQHIHAVALQAYEAEPFIREHIIRAHALIGEGKMEEARGCCRKILTLDEMNREAQDLLREIESRQKPQDDREGEAPDRTGGLAGRAVPLTPSDSPGGGRPEPFSYVLEGPEEEHHASTPEVVDPMTRATESVSGGLFELQGNEDVLNLSLGSLDLDGLDAGIERRHAFRSDVGPGTAGQGPEDTQPTQLAPPAPTPTAAPDRGVEARRSRTATPSPPPAGGPEGGDFQFDEGFEFPAEGEPGLSGPDPKGIEKLLEAARAALAAGNFEGAVASASRALAIDPDSEAATQLMEQAREGQERHVRRIDDLMDQAHRCVDHKKLDEAEKILRELLALRPDHREAGNLLVRVSAERERRARGAESLVLDPVDLPPATGRKAASAEAPSAVTEPPVPLATVRKTQTRSFGAQPILSPPRREKPSFGLRSLLLVLLPLLLLAGAWFLYRALFGAAPPSRPVHTAPAAVSPEKIDVGKASNHGQAAASPQAASIGAVGAGAPVVQEAKAKDLVRDGRKALESGSTEAAVDSFRAAVASDPADEEARDLLAQASARLQKEQQLRKETDDAARAFAEKRYGDALRIWYRLPEETQKGDVSRYTRNAWYNMGIESLQISDCRAAISQFNEVLQIAPNDRNAAEAKKMAENYENRPKDSAYVRFANSLQPRPMDAR